MNFCLIYSTDLLDYSVNNGLIYLFSPLSSSKNSLNISILLLELIVSFNFGCKSYKDFTDKISLSNASRLLSISLESLFYYNSA